jgi:hypothetical protein
MSATLTNCGVAQAQFLFSVFKVTVSKDGYLVFALQFIYVICLRGVAIIASHPLGIEFSF